MSCDGLREAANDQIAHENRVLAKEIPDRERVHSETGGELRTDQDKKKRPRASIVDAGGHLVAPRIPAGHHDPIQSRPLRRADRTRRLARPRPSLAPVVGPTIALGGPGRTGMGLGSSVILAAAIRRDNNSASARPCPEAT